MVAVTLSLAALAVAAEAVVFEPPASDAVLFNPGMGLYLQYPPTDAKADEWFMAIADIAYYRLDWAEVNPEPGVYRFDQYFGPLFEFWVNQRHKRVAFRVMCENMHSAREYVTPKWVFDQGVPAVPHAALRGQMQPDPVFWDSRYLDLQAEFVAKLGEWLDGRPGLEFVDIGSIGEWGEMHLARWSTQELADTGYTEAKYVTAYRRMIDAHVAAFPRTRIFLNVGGPNRLTINDYAAVRGVHFRQDGLMPAGASYDVGGWLYGPYSRRGVVCNFEFHSGWDEMLKKGWDVPTTIEKGLSAPISYLNTNLFGGGGYRRAPEEARRLLTEAARRLGYRFVITRVETPGEVVVSPGLASRLRIASTWRNDGVAPCYDSHAVVWSLVDQEGRTVASETVFPPVPTTQWWPGEEQQVAAVLRLPAGTAPGPCRLRVTMIVPETGQAIALDIAGRDEQGGYALQPVTLKPGSATQAVVYQEGFEAGRHDWSSPQSITVTADDGAAHGGTRSLRVEGTLSDGWNYASLRLPAPLQPGALYRLSGWMRVERIEPQGKPPFLKIGINDADGRWLTNLNTGRYDVGRPGIWQELSGLIDVPVNGARFDLAIEKGDNTTEVNLSLRLDDLRLELVEN